MDINTIRNLCMAESIYWTTHVAQRLIKRRISPDEVIEALMNGRIIEEYPDDYPFPSCLILGCTLKKRSLHVVCSIVSECLTIITAYQPDPNKWDDTFSKRRDKNG